MCFLFVYFKKISFDNFVPNNNNFMEIKKKYWEHLNSKKMQGVKVTTKLWKRSPFYAKIFTRLLTRDLGSLLSMSGSPHHFLQIYWIFLKLNKLNLTQLSFFKSPFFLICGVDFINGTWMSTDTTTDRCWICFKSDIFSSREYKSLNSRYRQMKCLQNFSM